MYDREESTNIKFTISSSVIISKLLFVYRYPPICLSILHGMPRCSAGGLATTRLGKPFLMVMN